MAVLKGCFTARNDGSEEPGEVYAIKAHTLIGSFWPTVLRRSRSGLTTTDPMRGSVTIEGGGEGDSPSRAGAESEK